nr:hypothetical protein KitaXyl93_40230 [Kitasatospora sp. Xyl93]
MVYSGLVVPPREGGRHHGGGAPDVVLGVVRSGGAAPAPLAHGAAPPGVLSGQARVAMTPLTLSVTAFGSGT